MPLNPISTKTKLLSLPFLLGSISILSLERSLTGAPPLNVLMDPSLIENAATLPDVIGISEESTTFITNVEFFFITISSG